MQLGMINHMSTDHAASTSCHGAFAHQIYMWATLWQPALACGHVCMPPLPLLPRYGLSYLCQCLDALHVTLLFPVDIDISLLLNYSSLRPPHLAILASQPPGVPQPVTLLLLA